MSGHMRAVAARFATAFLAAASAAVLVGPFAHADESWLITSFQADINIAAESTVTVKEDIRVDFGSLHQHGIFRTIPLRYRYDDNHDRVYSLQVQSVTDGFKPVRYVISGFT